MEYREYETKITGTTGIRSLWLEFRGADGGARLFNLDKCWFE
jgi:hypothetical protein